LITYHKGDKSYSFLNLDKIKTYDDLNSLFFQVLVRKYDDRNQDVKKTFEKVPYLNSSLFEPTEIEQVTLFISNLKDDKTIPVISSTILKNDQGKKRTGNLTTLEYLFDFLNAYDFTSEGSEEIQEDNKSLINASVLGLIFEKINGYKEGSFFTPGLITMYMCRETIRKSVVQKFNETKKWNCSTVEELYDKIEDRKEANEIVNSIKICDPAVGSGHFLVSALNEMIAVKNDLKILQDRTGKRLKEYQVEVVNDELIVTDEEGELFDYNPTNKESQRIQETLFHEKQTIIENCLFGVDINPNSVKICRLRLWIELLKNAYYKNASELETLPNIDINIKCGNSLVSRFAIDTDLSQALKKSKWSIDSYRIAVDTYRNAESKEQKREMKKLIADIKLDFRSEIDNPFKKKIAAARGKIDKIATEINTQKNWGDKVNKQLFKDLEKATASFKKLEVDRDDIETNKIYENAFEWRFEFPEVLNDNGDFIGFDVIIGNPPYLSYYSGMAVFVEPKEYEFYINNYDFITNKKAKNRISTVMLFLELSTKLLKLNGEFANIIDINIFSPAFELIRMFMVEKVAISKIITNLSVFEGVGSGQVLLFYKNEVTPNNKIKYKLDINGASNEFEQKEINQNNNFNFQFDLNSDFVKKIKGRHLTLDNCCYLISGMNIGGVKDYFLSETRIDDTYHTAILSGNIFRYQIDYPNKLQTRNKRNYFIRFDKNIEKYIRENKIGTPGIGADDSKFKKEKLLIRRPLTGDGKLAAAYSDNIDHYSDVTVYIINETILPIKFLLGVINSKLATWYSRKAGIIRFEKGQQPQITINKLKEFPIPNKKNEIISNIIKCVNNRISETDKSKFELIENQIDQLVYKLYDLTEDEIKIIEGNG